MEIEPKEKYWRWAYFEMDSACAVKVHTLCDQLDVLLGFSVDCDGYEWPEAYPFREESRGWVISWITHKHGTAIGNHAKKIKADADPQCQ